MTLAVDTPHGPARVTLDEVGGPHGLLVLGHGAGGGVDAPDLLAARDAALDRGWAVARVLQPYRVAGRRAPAPAAQLDEAWAAVLEVLADRFPGVPQVHGGRSSGARVACRGAPGLGPVGVLALAFPLHAPARKDGTRADRSPEIDAVTVPVLVVQGERDPFGLPPVVPGRSVVTVSGDHSLRARGPVRDVVAPWLAGLRDPHGSGSARRPRGNGDPDATTVSTGHGRAGRGSGPADVS